MKLYFINQTKRKIPKKFLTKWTENLFYLIDQEKLRDQMKGKNLGVIFTNQKNITQLNLKYRKINKPTDILSFSSLDPQILGELIICSDIAHLQAKQHHLSYQLELGYLILHGVLHLLGFEHENGEQSAKIMYHFQDSLFESLCRQFETAKKRKRSS